MPPTPENADGNTSPPPTEEGTEVITKGFLQKVLKSEAGNGPCPELLSYQVAMGTKPGDNYMSLIYTIDLNLKNPNGSTEKRHMLIKCYPNHPSRQEFTNKSNVFFKEMEVYRSWMPELRRLQTEVVGLETDLAIKLPYPKYVHGQCIDFESPEGKARITDKFHSLDNYIIMEDMKKTYGFRMTNRREALDIDHMRLVYSALAKVHSLSWAYRHHVEKEITKKFSCFVPNLNEEDMAIWTNMMTFNVEQAKKIFDEEFGPGNRHTQAANRWLEVKDILIEAFMGKKSLDVLEKELRVQPVPEKFGKDAEEPWTIICHGDCWSNNLLFRYDETTKRPVEVILLDLQMAQETCVVNDLQYVMYACTDAELRKAHLDELLQLYHDTFNECCALLKTPTLPGFCMDSLRFRFHRSKFVGYMMAMTGLPLMLKEEDKVVNMEEMEEGKDLGQAFEDLCSGADSNLILKKRLIGVSQEMIDDAVL